MNGAALGGGLELALHCDIRTLAANVRHVGFPEVFLGLFPAWGGTQLTPRLVGAEAAVRLIVDNPLRQNRLIRAAEALELGLVDHVLEPSSSSTSRSSCSCGGSSPAAGSAGPQPTLRTHPRSSGRHAPASTTSSTARRPHRTARSS